MNADNQFCEVRCPSIRNHFIYKRCGSLMGGVLSGVTTRVLMRCPSCGTFWLVEVDESGCLALEPATYNKRIRFLHQIREIKHGDRRD